MAMLYIGVSTLTVASNALCTLYKFSWRIHVACIIMEAGFGDAISTDAHVYVDINVCIKLAHDLSIRISWYSQCISSYVL